MNMRKEGKSILAVLLALLMMLTMAVGAFADTEEPEETEEAEAVEEAEEAEEEEQLDIIGTETEGGFKVKITNAVSTGATAIYVRVSGTGDAFVGSILAEGDVFEPGESCWLCLPFVPESAEEEAEAADEPEKAEETEDADGEDAAEEEPILFDLEIVWADGTVGPLHNMDLADMNECQLQRKDYNNLPYLTYTSLETEEEIDTFDAELAICYEQLANGTWVYNGNYTPPSSSGSSGSSGGSSSSGSSSSNNTGCIGNDAGFFN